MPDRILIAGYYGYGNCGDEAILSGMLHDLRALEPAVDVVVLTGDPAATQETHGVEAVDWADVASIVASARRCDLLLVGGGGLFHDYWEARPEDVLAPRFCGLASYAGIPLLARLLGKPCMLYSVGVGPLRTESGQSLTRAAFELSQCASVRDQGSRQALQAIGLPDRIIEGRVTLAADPAFSLPPAPPNVAKQFLMDRGIEPGTPLLGVCLRPWDFGVDQDRWVREVAWALERYLVETDRRAVFIPFQARQGSRYEDDVAVGRSVIVSMPDAGRCVVLDRPLEPHVASAVLGQCTAVLAMRMHAALFALRAGVPVVGLAYDEKVSSLLRESGVPDAALPPGAWEGQTLLRKLLETRLVWGPAPAKSYVEQAPDRALESARLALSLLRQPSSGGTAVDASVGEFALGMTGKAARLEQEVGDRTRQVRELESKVETLRSQRDDILRERNQLEVELGDLRSTLGVRLVNAYWRLLKRLFPEGGRARQAFMLIRGLLRHGWRSPWGMPGEMGADVQVAAGTVPAGALQDGAPSGSSFSAPLPDPRCDLVRLEEQVSETKAERVVAIFSTTRLNEDEGQRSTQLALELARRGVPVVFVYWRWAAEALAPQDRLGEGILQLPLEAVVRHPESLCGSFRGLERVALFEFPYPELVRTLASANALGWITGYDVVDDWQEFKRVGQADWYDRSFEYNLALTADFVTAVNARLASRIQSLGRNTVSILPNGMRPGIERIDRVRPLERGEITVGYFGYLSGAWFDWELVAGLARSRPSWRIYLIGYGGGPGRVSLPANVVLLGKQPQTALASYAANWEVAIVPFKPGPLSENADPVKTYEYLAMGLPVVVTGVYPPQGGESLVGRAGGVDEFAARIESSIAERDLGAESRRLFAADSTWSHRVDTLLELLEQGADRVSEKRWLARPLS